MQAGADWFFRRFGGSTRGTCLEALLSLVAEPLQDRQGVVSLFGRQIGLVEKGVARRPVGRR